MSKLREQFVALNAEINEVFSRGEVSPDNREDLDAKVARLKLLRADVAHEETIAAEAARLSAAGVTRSEGATLTRSEEAPSFAGLIHRAVQGENVKFDRDLNVIGDLDSNVAPAVGRFMDQVVVKTPAANSMFQAGRVPADVWLRPYISRVISASAGSGFAAGEQVNEGDALVSIQVATDKKTVVAHTVGAYAEASVQADELSNPSALALAERDLARGLAWRIEQRVTAAIVAAATDSHTLSLTADGEDIWNALIEVGYDLEDQTGGFDANVIYMGKGRAQYVQGLFATDGRPLFPPVGPSNALGTSAGVFSSLSIPGARIVVSPQFPTNFFAVGNTDLLEWYWTPRGIKREEEDVTDLTKKVGISGFYGVHIWDHALISLAP